MPENESQTEKKPRKYARRASPQPPIAPNPTIVEMESGLVPLVNQRLEANRKVAFATGKANQANLELQAAQNELQQIEGEIQFRMQLIAQIRNGGMPIPTSPYAPQQGRFSDYPTAIAPSAPYQPVVPFPPTPGFGVSSYPANNRGLYPDATDRAESATDFMTPELRMEFERGRRQ